MGLHPKAFEKRAELSKHKVPQDLHEKLALMVTPQPLEVLRKVEKSWWNDSGALQRARKPKWCIIEGAPQRPKMPASVVQYDLSHRLLLEINAFLGGEPPPHRSCGAKLTHSEFFAVCGSKSGNASELAPVIPFPAHLVEQCSSGLSIHISACASWP